MVLDIDDDDSDEELFQRDDDAIIFDGDNELSLR